MFAKKFFFVCAGLLCLGITYHVGANNATAQSPAVGEVAVGMGSVAHDAIIPLPTYRDGTTALPSECRWIVSPGYVNMTRFDPVLRCEATYNSTVGPSMSWLGPDDPLDRARANYMIVAIRNDAPTPVQQSTWGSVKARYR